MFTYRLCHFEIFIHTSVNIIFKFTLIGKYIFVIFLNLLVIRNFRGTCSSIEMLQGYMARESLGRPVLNLNLGNSDRLQVFVALIDSLHGSLTEYEQNGERERTAANNFIVRF